MVWFNKKKQFGEHGQYQFQHQSLYHQICFILRNGMELIYAMHEITMKMVEIRKKTFYDKTKKWNNNSLNSSFVA